MKNRKGKVRLLAALKPGLPDEERLVLAESKARGWSALDYSLLEETIPDGHEPHLAITNHSIENPLYTELRRRGVRTVRIGIGPSPLDSTIPAVVGDSAAEGRLAANHYAERGFRSVGSVKFGDLSSYDEAFRDHATELGCKYHILDVHEPSLPDSMPHGEMLRELHQRFLKALAKAPKPIGLLLRGDRLAARICNFCTMSSIKVPDEVAILGRGDDPTICDLAPVRLSSIHLNIEAGIAAAFGLLDDMLAGRSIAKTPVRVPPAGITTRESTDVRSTQNPDVTKALRYMWDHYNDLELSVDTIAKVAGFSRRKLERLFRAELDQTVNEALLARRLERCCEFLITTDTNVSDLCHAVGLRSREHLHRAFKRTYGVTMKEYRKKHRQ